MNDPDKAVQERYHARSKRLIDAAQLKVPDRIPISIEDEGVFVGHGSSNWGEVMYDVLRAVNGAKKFYLDLDQDTHAVPYVMCPGQIYDVLDFRQMRWPNAREDENRLENPNVTFQFVEPGTGFEAMHPDEYDWFMNDPTDFMIRGFWPKMSRTLIPLKNLPAMWAINSYSRLPFLAPFGEPETVRALEALTAAGREAMAFNEALKNYTIEMVGLGYPPRYLAGCSAPFDFFGDYMRGTVGRMLDMYRHGEKLKEAVEKVTPMILEQVLARANARLDLLEAVMPGVSHPRHVGMHLHGGAGGLMSNSQFKEFYWPTLKKILLDLIETGFTPYMFSEGVYDDRLEIIKDLPEGKVVWHIEEDIFKAKEILGGTCCIEGGPPASIMGKGTEDDVKAYARKLIDVCGKGGGFIMGVAHSLLDAKFENVKALSDFTKEYGAYR